MLKVKTVALAFATLLVAASAQAEPIKIRMGYVQLPGHLGPILFQDGGGPRTAMKHYGKSYVVDPIRFRGTTPAIQALAAQELDIASQSPSSFALAVQNAKVDIKIVGDTFQDNGKTHYASPFMVLKDSGINKIEDLKGKRIASNAIGSASDTGMRRMLARHGIGEKDFNTIETAFGNMPAMLLSKKVDMIVVLPQFQRLLDKDREKVKSLFSMRDAVGAQQTIMWVARADSMAKNRAAWVDYFEDYLRGLRWVLDPKNHAEAIKAVVAFTKQSPESVDYAFTENDYYRDPNGEPSLQGIKNGLQEALESGVLKQPLENVESHMDLSPLREARKRIDGDKASSLR